MRPALKIPGAPRGESYVKVKQGTVSCTHVGHNNCKQALNTTLGGIKDSALFLLFSAVFSACFSCFSSHFFANLFLSLKKYSPLSNRRSSWKINSSSFNQYTRQNNNQLQAKVNSSSSKTLRSRALLVQHKWLWLQHWRSYRSRPHKGPYLDNSQPCHVSGPTKYC